MSYEVVITTMLIRDEILKEKNLFVNYLTQSNESVAEQRPVCRGKPTSSGGGAPVSAHHALRRTQTRQHQIHIAYYMSYPTPHGLVFGQISRVIVVQSVGFPT